MGGVLDTISEWSHWITQPRLIAIIAVPTLTLAFLGYMLNRRRPRLRLDGDTRPPLAQVGRRRVRAAKKIVSLTVIARNTGHGDAEIHKLWLVIGDNWISTGPQEGSDPVRGPIKPNDRKIWHFGLSQLQLLAKRHGPDLVVRPVVEWGSGKTAKGPKLRGHVDPPPPPPEDALVIEIGPITEDLGWEPLLSWPRRLWRRLG
jgi:hypothetical protein